MVEYNRYENQISAESGEAFEVQSMVAESVDIGQLASLAQAVVDCFAGAR